MTTLGTPKEKKVYAQSTHHLHSITSTVGRPVTSSLEAHLLELKSCRIPCRACHIAGETRAVKTTQNLTKGMV